MLTRRPLIVPQTELLYRHSVIYRPSTYASNLLAMAAKAKKKVGDADAQPAPVKLRQTPKRGAKTTAAAKKDVTVKTEAEKYNIK